MQLKCLVEEGGSQSEAVPKDIRGRLTSGVKVYSFGMSMERVPGRLAVFLLSIYVC